MIAAKIDTDLLEVVKYFTATAASNETREQPWAMVKDDNEDDGVFLIGYEDGDFEDEDVDPDGERIGDNPWRPPYRSTLFRFFILSLVLPPPSNGHGGRISLVDPHFPLALFIFRLSSIKIDPTYIPNIEMPSLAEALAE